MNNRFNILFLICLSILLCYCRPFLKQERASNEDANKLTSLDSLLNGMWLSKGDSNDMLVINNRTIRNFYNNKIVDSGFYSFKKIVSDSEEMNILAVFYSEGDTLFYEIENITDSSLSLMYMARGNVLGYRRIEK